MSRLLLAVATFVVLLQATEAVYCKKSTTSWLSGTYYTYIYCSYGCCGTTSIRYCCSYSSYSGYSTNYSTSTYSYWNIGVIVGAVIGGIIGLITLIVIIVVIIKACTKSGSHGRVVHPVQQTQPTPNVFVTNTTGNQAAVPPYPQTQPGVPPPPYAGPSYPAPAPGPVYPYPVQSSGQLGVPDKTG